jgi:hypothetical protein
MTTVSQADFASLVTALQALASGLASTNSVQRSESNKNSIARPSSFKGKSEDARTYLTMFTNWALNQGMPLNSSDRTTAYDKAWISSFLSGMEGEAAKWAAVYLEEVAANARDNTKPFPFAASWPNCEAAFRARFLPIDEESEARRELGRLRQTSSVPDYVAMFKQLAARTGYSSADQYTRFYDGLKPEIKDALVYVEKPKTLEDLQTKASAIDFRRREREGERKGERSGYRPSAPVDSMAMDIDATRFSRSREEFMEKMKGRCYGCGSTAHLRSEGNHGGTVCSYCKRKGHLERVCQDKFMGKPPGGPKPRRQISATSESRPFSLFDEEPSASPVSNSGPAPSTPPAMEDLRKTIEATTAALQRFSQGF